MERTVKRSYVPEEIFKIGQTDGGETETDGRFVATKTQHSLEKVEVAAVECAKRTMFGALNQEIDLGTRIRGSGDDR